MFDEMVAFKDLSGVDFSGDIDLNFKRKPFVHFNETFILRRVLFSRTLYRYLGNSLPTHVFKTYACICDPASFLL